MFFDFINSAINLDASWIANVFLSNLHYVFLFAVIGYFFFGPAPKKTAVAAALLAIMGWAYIDFEMMSGWVLFVGGFLGIYYITKMALNAVVEDIPTLKKRIILVNEAHFLILLVGYNIFLM